MDLGFVGAFVHLEGSLLLRGWSSVYSIFHFVTMYVYTD